jgi:hypothetical protein
MAALGAKTKAADAKSAARVGARIRRAIETMMSSLKRSLSKAALTET